MRLNAELEGQVTAPEFPLKMDWLNTERALSLRELRGKMVLLDFWTYCCINCMHVIPELKKLEKKYAHQLVVIGVHSAKFTTEKATDNIRQAALRYEIEHPIVNDKDFEIWQSYAARSWPTLVLINPKGKIIRQISGEGVYEPFDDLLSRAIPYFREQGVLDEKPLDLQLERQSALPSLLSFPGKILADEQSSRLFISDSNHNRIIITTLEGDVLDVIGAGAIGSQNGSFAAAEFNHPQGVALDEELLYICDTENHLIRKADLKARTVETLVGTGEQARTFNVDGIGTDVALNSPWDVLAIGGLLFVAMAGPHQIWVINPDTGQAVPYAGSGRENHIDGPLRQAALAQPSGITTDGQSLIFADSEVSSIRAASLNPNGAVSTIVGEGLFDFGDVDSGTVDGTGKLLPVRLQHPLGVTYLDGKLYVADTYNHKIKVLNPKSREIQTFAGAGERGSQDGEARTAQFNEPSGISATSNSLFVADTSNHLIRKIDLATKQVSTLELKGLEKLSMQAVRKFRGRVVETARQAIALGKGRIVVHFTLPPGFKFTEAAPFYVVFKSSNNAAVKIAEGAETRQDFQSPLEIPVEAVQGSAIMAIDAVIYFCNTAAPQICLVDCVRILLPLEVNDGAANVAQVTVAVIEKGR